MLGPERVLRLQSSLLAMLTLCLFLAGCPPPGGGALVGDPNGESVQRMAEAFELGAIPRTLLIDSKGVVQADMMGAHSREELERALRKVGIGS